MKVISPKDKKLADGQEMTQLEATNCGGCTRNNLQVSIIVNNYDYNYGRFLRQAIDSTLNQTYSHIDWLFVPQSRPASLNWVGNKFKRALAITSFSWERNTTEEKC